VLSFDGGVEVFYASFEVCDAPVGGINGFHVCSPCEHFSGVFPLGGDLEVFWVYALGLPALVVDVLTFRYRPDEVDVRCSVRLVVFTEHVELAVAFVALQAADPEPALTPLGMYQFFRDFREEPWFDGLVFPPPVLLNCLQAFPGLFLSVVSVA